MRALVSIQVAASTLGVSRRHIINLIDEAAVSRKSRWKFGREIVDLTPQGSPRRTIRINLNAVAQGLGDLTVMSQPGASGSE